MATCEPEKPMTVTMPMEDYRQLYSLANETERLLNHERGIKQED